MKERKTFLYFYSRSGCFRYYKLKWLFSVFTFQGQFFALKKDGKWYNSNLLPKDWGRPNFFFICLSMSVCKILKIKIRYDWVIHSLLQYCQTYFTPILWLICLKKLGNSLYTIQWDFFLRLSSQGHSKSKDFFSVLIRYHSLLSIHFCGNIKNRHVFEFLPSQ